MRQKDVRGLYAVTPDETDTDKLVGMVEQALRGGAILVQYRNKGAGAAEKRRQAEALVSLCRRYGRPLIVNDDAALAVAVDADGVHLGGDDGDLAQARSMIGPDRLLGASCYNGMALAVAAQAAGADYLAFGAAFASSTKPGAVRAPLDLYRRAKAIGLPIVAIGGITAHNARTLIDAGADAVAVISALFDSPDIPATARTFASLFNTRTA